MTADVKIGVRLDTGKAKADADELGKAMAKSMVLLQEAVGFAKQGMAALVDVMQDSIKSALEQESADRRLTAALRLKGAAHGEELKRLRELNGELESKFAIDEAELGQLQASLLARGVHTSELEKATRATIGLAEVTGQDLASAGTTVAKVFDGNVAVLRKLGIEADTVSGALEQLTSFQSLAAEKAGGLGGTLFRLDDAWGDLKRTLGEVVTNSQPLKDAIDEQSKGIARLGETVTANKEKIQGFFDSFVGETSHQLTIIRQGWSMIIRDIAGLEAPNAKTPQPGKAMSLADWNRDAEAAEIQDQRRIGEMSVGAIESLKGQVADQKAAQREQDAARREFEAKERVAQQMAELAEDSRKELETIREEDFQKERSAQRDHNLAMREEDKANLIEQTLIADEKNRNTQDLLARQDASYKAQQMLTADAARLATQTIAGSIGDTVAAVASGQESVGDALAGMLGSLISTMGQFLISAGTTAVAAGAIATLAPGLGAIFGVSPMAAGAGVAAIAVGAGLVALGASLGGGGAAAVPKAGGSGGGSQLFERAREEEKRRLGGGQTPGFRSNDRASAPITNIYNVTFEKGVITGTSRQIARDLRDILNQGATLGVGGVR